VWLQHQLLLLLPLLIQIAALSHVLLTLAVAAAVAALMPRLCRSQQLGHAAVAPCWMTAAAAAAV
jgi:hypothetical protein